MPTTDALIPAGRLIRSERGGTRPNVAALAERLEREIEGEVRFDAGARGLYAQDASTTCMCRSAS